MTPSEAAKKLYEIDDGTGCTDNEIAHAEADHILYLLAPAEVQEAYDALQCRVPFWYA